MVQNSPKGYTAQQLQQIALSADDNYRRLSQGATHTQMLGLASSQDPADQQASATYGHLFNARAGSEIISAEFEGTDLVVQRGNHRVRAAQQAGVDYLPVEVRATSEGVLDRLDAQLQRSEGTRYSELSVVHKRLEAERSRTRDREPPSVAPPAPIRQSW
jgi:hypothetical protein